MDRGCGYVGRSKPRPYKKMRRRFGLGRCVAGSQRLVEGGVFVFADLAPRLEVEAEEDLAGAAAAEVGATGG